MLAFRDSYGVLRFQSLKWQCHRAWHRVTRCDRAVQAPRGEAGTGRGRGVGVVVWAGSVGRGWWWWRGGDKNRNEGTLRRRFTMNVMYICIYI